jgi:hypothetical protein
MGCDGDSTCDRLYHNRWAERTLIDVSSIAPYKQKLGMFCLSVTRISA